MPGPIDPGAVRKTESDDGFAFEHAWAWTRRSPEDPVDWLGSCGRPWPSLTAPVVAALAQPLGEREWGREDRLSRLLDHRVSHCR